MNDEELVNNNIKLLSLISGGIDSPVATYMMLSHGATVEAVYFDSTPFSDEKTKNKVLKIITQLRLVTKSDLKFHIIQHGDNQELFAKECNRHLGCILCKRMMLRLAQELAHRIGAAALITGESLGQVASQTLQNIYVETQVVNLPIIRPLIGLDKLEIESIAKQIGTYDISILPGLCCTIVPKKPSTKARLERILQEESKIDMQSMVVKSMKNIETI
jgi:thiamine biosynthesis protein ThiI